MRAQDETTLRFSSPPLQMTVQTACETRHNALSMSCVSSLLDPEEDPAATYASTGPTFDYAAASSSSSTTTAPTTTHTQSKHATMTPTGPTTPETPATASNLEALVETAKTLLKSMAGEKLPASLLMKKLDTTKHIAEVFQRARAAQHTPLSLSLLLC